MKRSLSILMALILTVTLLPSLSSAAADTAAEKAPQHVAQDFENGWDSSAGILSSNSSAEWTDRNTCGESQGSLEFSTTQNYGALSFPLRTETGNTYEMSLWVRMNETPKTQNATFIVYNPAVDGNGKLWNQFTAHHNEAFEAGKWVLVTAVYESTGTGTRMPNGIKETADTLPDGTVEFRLGSGIPSEVMESGTISFAMDDFFVMPKVNNQRSDDELIENGGFDTETAFQESWEKNGTANITYLEKGACGTPGAMQIDVISTWGTMGTKNNIDLQFCRDYKLSFWAKAMNEESVGRDMWAYLVYSGDRDVGNWDHITNGSNPTLSDEWQYFEFNISLNYIVEIVPDIRLFFRAGTNDELNNGLRPSYAVDQVSLKQIDDANFSINAEIFGSMTSETGVLIQLSFIESTKGSFVYRIVKETEWGDYCLKSGNTKETILALEHDGSLTDSKVRLDVIGIDSYGNYSKPYSSYLDESGPQDTVTLQPDQYLWNDDVKTLSATVSYQNKTDAKGIRTIAALYAANGALIQTNEETVRINAGAEKTWSVTINAEPNAAKVRFFAWFDETMAPATYQCELKKTTTGAFIYVDSNSVATVADGSFNAPFKTLNNARETLQSTLLNSTEENIYVVFQPGEYVPENYNAFVFTPEDCSAEKNVIFTSFSGEKAKITGARHIAGFSVYDAEKGIYRAKVPAGTNSRQLYVNGIKATRARSVEDIKGFTNLDQGTKDDPFNNLGLISTDTSFLDYKYPNEVELAFIENWRHQYIMVDTISPTEDGQVHFGFTDDGNAAKWKSITRLNTPAKLPVYVENALELLDEEGEWYLDTHENFVYYKPRYFEDMQTADVVIPAMEKLVNITGTVDAPLQNIRFENIDFEYSTWNYPTENRAFLNGQNATYSNGTGGMLMDGAVELKNVKNITFDNCDFSRLGSIALKMTGAVQNCSVIGNEFYELSGTAIALGDVSSNEWNVRYPTEKKYYITDNLIANNYIHKVATDYYSAAAICAGFPKNTVIRNNELTDGSYSGMHTGWGWGSTAPSGTENFVVEKNYIHDFMNWRLFDGGGIYTLGNTGGTAENPNLIHRNYFKDIKNLNGDIYPDEGSTFWKVSENVVDQKNYPIHYAKETSSAAVTWLHIWTSSIHDIYVENNFSTTSTHRNNGTNISYEEPHVFADAVWPEEALCIIRESGIEKPYQNRFHFDLQMLKLPRKLEISKGNTQTIAYSAITSKDKLCDLSDFEIRVKTNNPDVVTATANTVTGVAEGKGWITLMLCRNVDGKVQYYDEHTFYVVVK